MNVTAATAAVIALLEAADAASPVTKVATFLGEPDAVMDSDGRAHAYNAVYPGAGTLDELDRSVCGTSGPRVWRFQVTAAGGDIDRALRALERAQTVLTDQRIDGTTGFIREDGDGGPLREDRDAKPPRWFVPLLYRVDL